MCRETEEFGRTCECLFQLFSPQMHCMHQQPHIKVNCARKDMFNNQCSLECNWNIYIIRRLYSGTGAQAGPRLELVSLTSRGGNAVFVTHLVCVGCSYMFLSHSTGHHRGDSRPALLQRLKQQEDGGGNATVFDSLHWIFWTWRMSAFSALITQVYFWLLLMKFICCRGAVLCSRNGHLMNCDPSQFEKRI